MNIKQELENAIKILKENNIEEPIAKAKLILANILKQNKEYLLINENKELNNSDVQKFKEKIEKLCEGTPLQYLTNKQAFMALDFYVNENVLIPQPDTEILVEEVINICKKEKNKNAKILDLCTGSGAIGISIAKNIEKCDITLLDISKNALEVANQNYKKILKDNEDVKVNIVQSDLFSNLDKTNRFNIIVSNPPYIKTDIIKTLNKDVQNEPIIALDGGKDGLDFYKKIISQAVDFLEDNGYLCLEIGYDQKDDVIDLIEKTKKYCGIYSKKDLSNNDRIIICKKKEN